VIASIDPYLGKRYDRVHYNCLHFSRDVWLDATGIDITDVLRDVLDPNTRKPTRKLLQSFQEVKEPVDPCLVMMRRPRLAPHIGVWIRGKILHLQERGAEYQPLEIASVGFSSARYYICR
jgi:hypothetical protein